MDRERVRPDYIALSVILLLVGTSITIVQYKIPSILENVMAMYDMTSATGSWLMSVFTAVGIFLSLPTGSLTKKLGPKRVLLLGCGVIVAGSVIGAFATSAWLMIFSRAVEGVAFVFITVAGPLAVEKYVAPEHQGTANGIWSLWICFGSVIGSTITPMMFEILGLTGTWLAYAIIVAVMALVLMVAVRVPASVDALRVETPEEKVSLADYLALAKPNALLYFFAYLVFNIEILAVLSYTPTFLQSQGMNASLSGFASSLPGLLAVVSALVFGKLIDRSGRTKVFYVVALIAAAPATFLMLTQAGPLLWAGAFLMGLIGYGIPVACLTSLPQIAGRKELMPAAMGVLMLVQCLGEFLGSLVTPMLLGPDLSNWMFCGMCMGVLGIAAVVAIALCRFK
ncbi:MULTISPECIES: CynX/NimT family MFS transporter [unclassified Adlercreutzia]|uniref:MFS transporter n=1 Tax=unclassified Adlercreutzia TaxID=2636013 RepID=UPI0013EB1BC2|nr:MULTISPECIES: MFS transporter [unclassified Adlercreutzia]